MQSCSFLWLVCECIKCTHRLCPGYFIGQAWRRRNRYMMTIGRTFTPARMCYISEPFLLVMPHLSRRAFEIPLPFRVRWDSVSAMRPCYVRHYTFNLWCSCEMWSLSSCGHANFDPWEHDGHSWPSWTVISLGCPQTWYQSTCSDYSSLVSMDVRKYFAKNLILLTSFKMI